MERLTGLEKKTGEESNTISVKWIFVRHDLFDGCYSLYYFLHSLSVSLSLYESFLVG